MAFPSQFTSIQTTYQDDISKDLHWALNVALAGNTTYDPYIRHPSMPVEQPSDAADCSSDDEDNLDPHGIFSSYSYEVHPGSFSSDFDQPFIPPASGNLNGCGRDVVLFPEEQSHHPHYPDFSSTPVDSFDLSEWVYEPSNPEMSASDAIITPCSSSNRVETSYDGSSSDEDAEGESEHCSPDDDDEYHPDLEIPTSKKRRANAQLDRFTLGSSSSSSSSSTSTSFPYSPSSSSRSEPGSSNSSSKRARLSFPSGNLQATPEKSLQMVNKPDPWACPVKDCTFVQRNRRKPDLRRHIKRHDPPSGEWVCCGVPVGLIGHYKLYGSERRHVFRGRNMIGGCLRSFSRKDSLRRHLMNKNVKCG